MVVLKASNEPCKGCGGNLRFDPKTQNLVCEKCGRRETFAKTKIIAKRKISDIGKNQDKYKEWIAKNKLIECASCGARIILNNLEYSATCPYCGRSSVSLSSNLPGIDPDVVIPFAFDKEEAVKKFKEKVSKKFYVPRAFKKKNNSGNVAGIYIPSFIFEAKSYSSYEGLLLRQESYTSNGKTYTRTVVFPIAGTKNLHHDDIMIEASSKVDQKQLSEILPYSNKECYDFKEDYIRGYVVEHYSTQPTECYHQAKDIMDKNIRRSILSDYSYSGVQTLNIRTTYRDEKFLYRVSPIYKFEYKYKNKAYQTIMNGQTGKLGGGLPKSKIKIAFTIIIPILIVLAIVLLINFLG